MRDPLNHLGLRYINQVGAEIKIEATFKAGSEIMHTEDAHHIIKIFKADIGVTLIIEEITGTMLEVVRDIGTIIVIIGGAAIEVNVTIGIGGDH